MNPDWGPEREPTPEELAAYFDGELTGDARVGIEAWLANHPEGRAEIEALRHLHAQYEPAGKRWAATLAGIEADLGHGRSGRPRSRRWSWALLAGGLAATVLGALLLRPPPTVLDTEPYPVVSADDVHIISMNPNDHGALVIVVPLALPEIDLARHEDVAIVGGNTDGIMQIDDWNSPMIVDPLVYEPR